MNFKELGYYTKDELIELASSLKTDLEIERQKRKEMDALMMEKDLKLRERGKELQGIFQITKLINEKEYSISYVLSESLKILKESYLYPEITCARITYDNKFYHTKNFKATGWKQSVSEFLELPGHHLTIEIYYLEERPELDEGPFLKEERFLLNTIGRELAVYLNRKHAEEEMRRKNKNFELIFNSVRDAVMIHDLKGRMLQVNKEAIRRLKYSRKELMQMKPEDLDDDHYATKVPERIAYINKNGYFKGETVHVTKRQIPIPTEINSIRINYENQPAILTVARDITERKKYEAELIQEKNKAEESTKLKSAFLANLSHEIRTPLNGILGFSDMLGEKEIDAHRKKEYIKYIKESGNKLITIVDDILDVSFIQTGQVEIHHEPLSINYFIDNLEESYKNKIQDLQKDIKINTHKSLADGSDFITSDPDKIQRIFIKLLDNALKFTREGEIEFGYNWTNAGRIEFYVKDTGIGVPEDSLEKIFESFRQYDQGIRRKYEGLGLGLSIAKGLVEQLGGSISLHSEFGNGTTVFFSIPCQKSKMVEVGNRRIADNIDLSGKKVLVVDDEVSHFDLIQEYLSEENIQVIHAPDGFRAIDILGKLQQVDLIFMDIMMPELDGIETYKKIQEMNPNIPVVALTVYASENQKKKLLKMGFREHLSKPLKKNKLLEAVSSFV